VIAVIGAVVLWAVHPPLLKWALRSALGAFCEAQGLELKDVTIHARLGSLIRAENLLIIGKSGSRLAIARLDASLSNPTTWFTKSARLIERAEIGGLDGFLNTDDLILPPPGQLPSAPEIRWIPQNLDLQNISLEIFAPDHRIAVRNLSGRFRARSTGRVTASEILVEVGGLSWMREKISAVTAWKDGTLWLGEMEIHQGFFIEEVAANLLNPGGPAISLLARVFGGSLRGDLTLGRQIDAAFWASNVPLDSLPELTGLSERVSGRLVEGRLTFRGDPSRPADAEASLRLYADAFRWNDRGWESLEIGASLIHQRLVVTDFDLQQKGNRVNFNGEISIAEGWSQIAKSPFLLNVSADLQELGALGDLIGGPLNEVSGRMSATGSVSGRSGQLDGFLSIESSGIEFRSLPVKSLKVETVFRRNEIEIAKAEIYSRKDFVEARGVIGLAAPHVYSGDLKAKIEDIAKYLGPFRAPGADVVFSGALDARWQGDGTWKAPSGAFDLRLTRFVSGATPAGVTGKFSGTYSPQNVYFSEFGVENGPVRLTSRATFASSGMTFADLEVRSGSSLLIEGAAFLPLDIFDLFAGADWRSSVALDREAYIRLVTPQDVQVANLLRLLGQQSSVQGILNLNVEARGLPGLLAASAAVSLNQIRVPGAAKFPDSSLQLGMNAAKGEATLEGSLISHGLSPVTVRARLPFGLAARDSAPPQWINPTGPLEIDANFPKSHLSVFSPLFPDVRRIAGDLSGQVTVRGTLANPESAGRAELRGGSLEITSTTPKWENVNAVVVFDKGEAKVESFQGTISGGPFGISGQLAFPGPSLDLRFQGTKIPISTEPGIPLRANIDLSLVARPEDGAITGNVRLVDGRIGKRLEVTPLGTAPPEDNPLRRRDRPSLRLAPQAFQKWSLGIKISNETPFLWSGDPTDGEIIPEITLAGTIGRPMPIGRITLRQIRATLPSASVLIPEGRIDFLPDAPWVPFLDIRGTAQISGYSVLVCAFGPADENKLLVRSEPPLSADELVNLLTTGVSTETSAFRQPAAPRGSNRLWEPAVGLLSPEKNGANQVEPTYIWRLK